MLTLGAVLSSRDFVKLSRFRVGKARSMCKVNIDKLDMLLGIMWIPKSI